MRLWRVRVRVRIGVELGGFWVDGWVCDAILEVCWGGEGGIRVEMDIG